MFEPGIHDGMLGSWLLIPQAIEGAAVLGLVLACCHNSLEARQLAVILPVGPAWHQGGTKQS